MPWVLLADRHDRHPIGASFGGQPKINDLGVLLGEDRHEHLVQSEPQNGRLVRGFAGVSRVINRPVTHRHALDREDRKPVLFVVVTGVIAKGAFERHLPSRPRTWGQGSLPALRPGVLLGQAPVGVRTQNAFKHNF